MQVTNPYYDSMESSVFNHNGEMEEELLLEVEKYMDGLTDLDLVTGDPHIGEYYFEWEDGLEICNELVKKNVFP
ncbi:MAG: hypothetical protein ACLTTH_16515 [Holdemanella porci]